MKWALKPDSKERWSWKYGQTYSVDFYNPYIDFSDFSLRLPGFSVPIMGSTGTDKASGKFRQPSPCARMTSSHLSRGPHPPIATRLELKRASPFLWLDQLSHMWLFVL